MLTNRANAICLLEVLKEYSDAEHIMSMQELIAKMNSIYGLQPDRRTVYSGMELLQELGYDICTYEENGSGYYLRSRDFEPSEVLLLTDAVYSFPFLPARQSEQLIAKLQQQLSCHQRKNYRNLTVVRPERKSDNKQVFWHIEQLDEAITLKCKVSFSYLRRRSSKKMLPRRERPYIVSPYALVFSNEHYYLICGMKGDPTSYFYRLDRMKDIELLRDEPAVGSMNKAAVRSEVYAFAGQPERIVLHCDSGMLDDVIDKFGLAVQIMELGEGRVSVSLMAAPQGVKYWALQYLRYMEIVEPKWLREEIIGELSNNPYVK